MKTLWEKKSTKVIAAVVAVAIIVIAVALALQANKEKPFTAAELLDLGEKYLLEMDYEQAIVQFTKAIEIEPKNERAYLGAAEAYVALGQEDKAIEILEQGLEQLPDSVAIVYSTFAPRKLP